MTDEENETTNREYAHQVSVKAIIENMDIIFLARSDEVEDVIDHCDRFVQRADEIKAQRKPPKPAEQQKLNGQPALMRCHYCGQGFDDPGDGIPVCPDCFRAGKTVPSESELAKTQPPAPAQPQGPPPGAAPRCPFEGHRQGCAGTISYNNDTGKYKTACWSCIKDIMEEKDRTGKQYMEIYNHRLNELTAVKTGG